MRAGTRGRTLAALGVAALALAAAAGGKPVAAAEQWQAYTYAPAALASYKGLDALAKELGDITGGEVSVTVSPGGSLPIKAEDIPQAIGDGVIQLGGTGSYAGYVPIGGIGRLPLLYDTAEEFNKAYAILEPELRKALDEKNVVLLGYYHYAVQTIWSRSEMSSLEDVKNVKFRVVAPEQAAAVQRLGATPISMMTPDVATALQRGAIDMLLTSASGGGKLWYEMLDTNYRLPVSWALELILLNKQAFEALSPENRQKVLEAGKKAGQSITGQLIAEDQALSEKFRGEGLKIKDPTPAEIAQARDQVRPYWDEWAAQKDAAAQEVLKKIRVALGK